VTLAPAQRLVALAGVTAAASLAVIVAPDAWRFVFAADLLILAVAVLDLLMAPKPSRVSARRHSPSRWFVLKPETVTVQVNNSSRQLLTVRIRDAAPAEARDPAPELAIQVGPGGENEASYQLLPLRRGRHSFGAIHLRYPSPLGLWDIGRIVPAAEHMDVYPNLALLDHYRLLAIADKMETNDARSIRRLGASAEFESLREYSFGDDTRKLDWKATARRGRLIVRQERAERNQTILILIDSGRLMNAEEDGVSKLDHAINAALLLAHVALSRGDRVGLCTFSHKVHAWLAPRGGNAQGRFIGETLYDLKGDYRESDHAKAMQLLANRHPKRSLVVTLTDFVDTTTATDLVTHLGQAARRHVVLLAALQDRFLARAAVASVHVSREGFRRAAALDLLKDRREVLEQIRHRGGLVLDATPADLSPRLLNRYLEVVLRGMV
jgi:uncharacterized protein (DUF58 family)